MQLQSINANVHIFDDQVTPLNLLLTFSGGSHKRLRVSGDGSQMLIEDTPLDEPYDIGGAGYVDVRDVTDEIDPTLRGANVDGIRELELSGQRIGATLVQNGASLFHFWVDDDELFWGNEHKLQEHDWLRNARPITGKPIKL
jgi:hypothetical protein